MSYWKNLPNTETPIMAESLERSEKYVIATATTNGDYKINVDVELGDKNIIKVDFPNSTDNTKQARLSIDNGNTYIPIKGLNGIDVENKKMELIYDFNNVEWVWPQNIVESGSNTNGKWIKYADGTMIQSGRYDTGNTNFSTAYGVIFFDNKTHIITFPIVFKEIYGATVSAFLNDGIGGVSHRSVPNTINVQVYAYSFTSYNFSQTIKIDWVAMGRWK